MDRKNTRPRGWPEAPSSSDLAALVRCEREFVVQRTEGEVRTQVRAAKAEAGRVEHARVERVMLAHHNQPAPASGRDTRCYVATELYGPDALQTCALRAWRDQALMPRAAGRMFVRTYYALSPSLVRAVRAWPRLRPAVAVVVDRVVRWAIRPR